MNSNLVVLCLAMRLLIIMLSFISMAMTQRECEPLIDHRCDRVIGKKFCCSDKNGFVTCQEEVDLDDDPFFFFVDCKGNACAESFTGGDARCLLG